MPVLDFPNKNYNIQSKGPNITGNYRSRRRTFQFLFLILPRTLAYLKIPINDPVDEPNFSFLIPILTCAPFLGFSSYLIKHGERVPRAVS